MNSDETTIDCIEEGDEIKIIEQLHGVDFSYYDLYLLKHKNEPKININVETDYGFKKLLHLTINTSIEEMIKIICFVLNIPEKINKRNYFFLFNGNKLKIDDKITLEDKMFQDGNVIKVIRAKQFSCNGKYLKVLVKDKNNNLILEAFAGTLETISLFYNYLINNYPYLNITKIKINQKEIQKNDERTFSSIGIRDDFIVNIE